MYKPRLMFQLGSKQASQSTQHTNKMHMTLKWKQWNQPKKQLQSHAAYALLQFQVATVNIVIAMHISIFVKCQKFFLSFHQGNVLGSSELHMKLDFALKAKLCILSNINIWRKFLRKAIWANKKWPSLAVAGYLINKVKHKILIHIII